MDEIKSKKKKNKAWETIESIGVALLIALAVRAFVLEPFKIPSPSMVPTLLIGDQIFVNKFVYGVRIPFTKIRLWNGKDPERGEVIVFLWPEDESLDFIKRVVGLPGDTVRVEGDKVYVNGELVSKEPLKIVEDPKHDDRVFIEPNNPYTNLSLFPGWDEFSIYREALGAHPHLTQYDRAYSYPIEKVIPPGHYFVMGDNRDHSDDSRRWGFVPRENIEGRAMFIWLSFDWQGKSLWQWLSFDWGEKAPVRWHRFGRWIY